MKTIKFTDPLSKKILDGKKRVTWRFFDDKDLQVGDNLILVNKKTNTNFARVEIVKITIKRIGDLSLGDIKNKFEDIDQVCKIFSNYYNRKIGFDDEVKMIEFNIKEVLV
ncbi:MAG: ASCH domain-containing protein [Candidatus Komeilibacteria bacterium]